MEFLVENHLIDYRTIHHQHTWYLRLHKVDAPRRRGDTQTIVSITVIRLGLLNCLMGLCGVVQQNKQLSRLPLLD